jgi:hypothetical protein
MSLSVSRLGGTTVLSPRKIFSVVALALAVGLALGCGNVPTAPVPGDQATVSAAQRSAESAGLLDPLESIVDGLVKLIVRTLRLVGSIGGSLSNGRWRLDIPANAIEGTATVTLGVPSLTSPVCQLEILPASQNSFSTPVTLTVDCSRISSDELQHYVILCYDPETRSWVPVEGSRVDLTTKTVSAPLHHFSTYSVGRSWGKSGW